MTDVEPVSWPARVVEVIDQNRVVINRGSRDGLKQGQRFLVYGLGASDLIDPDTKESLGRLEIVRGIGTITHVQERVCTLTSARTASPSKRIVRKNPLIFSQMETETIQEVPETLPFDDASKGDYVRPV